MGPKSAKIDGGQRVLYTIPRFLRPIFGARRPTNHKSLDFRFLTFLHWPLASKVGSKMCQNLTILKKKFSILFFCNFFHNPKTHVAFFTNFFCDRFWFMRMYVTKSGLWISWEFMQSKWLHKSRRKILTLTFPTISEQQVRGHGSTERIVRDFVLCNFQTWIPYYMWWWTFSVIESLIALFDISYYINFRLGFM